MATPRKSRPHHLFFTKKERIGITMLVFIIVVYVLAPYIYNLLYKPQPPNHSQFEKEIAQLNVQEDSSSGYAKRNDAYDRVHYQPSAKNNYGKAGRDELFYFDPNTLSVDGWIRLGIRGKTAQTIHKYVSKGGKFYMPEDIGKIWGLHPDEVQRLLPYVRIEQKPLAGYNKYPATEPYKTDTKTKYSIANVEINTADTTAFIALPGIGSKLAARIIAFREKLGGFYKIEQVAETYGLPDSAFQKIKSKLVTGSSNVKKININTATVDELKAHPYLRYNLANAIVQYRLQHGNFAAVSDVKKIMLFTDDVYNKAAPYLTVK